MKKILILATTPFLDDGLTKIVFDVIEYNKDIIKFEVASPFDFENKYGAYLKSIGISTYKLTERNKIRRYVKDIYKLVKKGHYDSVYINGNSAMMLMQAFPAKLAGTKVITHCHNTSTEHPLFHYLFKPIFNIIVDKKIGCSMLASSWAYRGKNIITIKNGVDVKKFKFDENNRRTMRKSLEWEDNIIIGHIGRFNYQKNHDKLLDIFDCMYKKNTDNRLLLIGDGELKKEIEIKISERKLTDVVKIIKHTDVPEAYMSAMDIMIMPSLFEGLCLVAIEAQANGLPILIDSFFSPETKSTDICRTIPLDATNEEWIEQIESMLRQGRKDVTAQLIEQQFDRENMMKNIQDILLG